MSVEPTPNELRDAFAAQLQTLPPAPVAPRYRPRTGRGPWPPAAAAGVLAVVAGVTVAVALRPDAAPAPSAQSSGPSTVSVPTVASTVDELGTYGVLATSSDLGCDVPAGVRVYLLSGVAGIDADSVCLATAAEGTVPSGATPLTIGGRVGFTWTVGGTVIAALPVELSGQPYFVVLVSGGSPNLLDLQQVLTGMAAHSVEPTPCNGACG